MANKTTIKLPKFTGWLVKRLFKKHLDKLDTNKDGNITGTINYKVSENIIELEVK